MPHRDQQSRTSNASNAQDLGAALDPFLKRANWGPVEFRSDCNWTPRGLAIAALMWACSGGSSLKERLEDARKVAKNIENKGAPKKISYNAFMHLLRRWTFDLRPILLAALHQLIEYEHGDGLYYAGYLVLGGDGTKIELPRTESNQAAYSPRSKGRKSKNKKRSRARSKQARARESKQKKSDSPQMLLTMLHHVRLQIPWDWRWGPSDGSERDQLLKMLPGLPENALIAADCGFVGYEFWSALLASKRQFVIRVGGNVKLLKKRGHVRGNEVWLWPDKALRKKQPPLKLRLVKVRTERQEWYLVTSVLRASELTDKQVGEIYSMRWRIEVFFRSFKGSFGRSKLRSHTAQHAAVELEWSLLGMAFMLSYARSQVPDLDDPISVARMLRAFRRAISHDEECPPDDRRLQARLSKAVVDRYQRKDKRSRNYPRKKYEVQAKPPRIAAITKRHIHTAKQLAA